MVYVNMKYLSLILFFLSLNLSESSTQILTSSDLGNLFIKYASDDLIESEFKLITRIFEIHRPVWNSESSNDPNIEYGRTKKGIRCFVCRSSFFALISLIKMGISDKVLINTATGLCSLAISTRKVCKGFMQLNMPILKYIIKTTPQAIPKTFCGILLQSYHASHTCSYDDPRFEWRVELPPKMRAQKDEITFTDPTPLKVAILSDVHIDLLYEPFGVADCNEPVCCRKGQKPLNPNKSCKNDVRYNIIETEDETIIDMDIKSETTSYDDFKTIRNNPNATCDVAGYWGDYRNCDTPIWAYFDTIDEIAAHETDLVYYVGDSIDHHIWETTYEQNDKIHSLIVNKMKTGFRKNTIVVPTIGNHESQPSNQFAPTYVKEEGLNSTWLYKSLAKKWSHYLSRDAFSSMQNRGCFSMFIKPGLRVISLNNNVAYKYNWWLIYDPLNPKNTLDWLVKELYKAEISEEKVHILSHIPAGDQDLIYTWTREYHRIVKRFSSTITTEFNGHLHSDEFKIFYKDNKAFNVAWGTGSSCTFQNFNLNYKVATFDGTSFEPINMVNYIYNLTEANMTPDERPRWFPLYNMRDSFEMKNLTPNAMDELVHHMVTDKKNLLDQYVLYASKLSDSRKNCSTHCKIEMLCNAVTSVLWERQKCIEIKKAYFSRY